MKNLTDKQLQSEFESAKQLRVVRLNAWERLIGTDKEKLAEADYNEIDQITVELYQELRARGLK